MEKQREKIIIRLGVGIVDRIPIEPYQPSKPIVNTNDAEPAKPRPKGPSLRHCLAPDIFYEWRERLGHYRAAPDDERVFHRDEMTAWLQMHYNAQKETRDKLQDALIDWELRDFREPRPEGNRWLKRDQHRLDCLQRTIQALSKDSYASSSSSRSSDEEWWIGLDSSSSSSTGASYTSSSYSSSSSDSDSDSDSDSSRSAEPQ